ncbi:MAG: hypothetical protein OXH59_08290 [Rhodospirillaceae bacterium]|nr:hypothetical protein [Rhodospirillaceae bacterium]
MLRIECAGDGCDTLIEMKVVDLMAAFVSVDPEEVDVLGPLCSVCALLHEVAGDKVMLIEYEGGD